MNSGRYVFAQVLSVISSYEFSKCVKRYNGNYRARGLNCWNQFVQLFFGQLTSRNGLRDICLCLNALDEIEIIPNSIYVMDKAYVDFKRLYTLNEVDSFFVVRAKENFRFKVLKSR